MSEARTRSLNVALFERRRHPREKFCGGALSAWGIDVLARVGLDDIAVGTPIEGIAVRANGATAVARPTGLGVVVRRSVFDHALAQRACALGAMLHEDTTVESVLREREGWRIQTTRGEVMARIIVGADGAAGGTRRMLGIRETARHARLYLVETPGESPRNDTPPGTLLFDLDVTVREGLEGYYWDFPAPLDGVAGTSRGIYHWNATPIRDAASLKTALLRRLAERQILPSAQRIKAHSIRPFVVGAQASIPGAILVGEAVGIDPVTGEGIAHALAFGALAATALRDAFDGGDFTFASWAHRIATSFVGGHLRQAATMAPWVYGPHAGSFIDCLTHSPTVLSTGLRWYRGEIIDRAARARVVTSSAARWISRTRAASAAPGRVDAA